MSVKPVAWLYEQHIDGVPAKFTPPVIKWEPVTALEPGWTETPLYSAPAPELAEVLQKLVEACNGEYHTGKNMDGNRAECELCKACGEAEKLLARITPK